MLIFILYSCAVIGIALLLTAAIIKLNLLYPSTDLNKLLVVVSSFKVKFTNRFITPNKSHIIAFNEPYRKMAIGINDPNTNKKAIAKLYTFDDIIGSEIVENALTLSKVSKTSHIHRTLNNDNKGRIFSVNHVEPSEVDESTAIIGELTLKIYINSPETPVYYISFLPGLLPIPESNSQYTHAFSQVLQVHDLIRGIVSRD